MLHEWTARGVETGCFTRWMCTCLGAIHKIHNIMTRNLWTPLPLPRNTPETQVYTFLKIHTSEADPPQNWHWVKNFRWKIADLHRIFILEFQKIGTIGFTTSRIVRALRSLWTAPKFKWEESFTGFINSIRYTCCSSLNKQTNKIRSRIWSGFW